MWYRASLFMRSSGMSRSSTTVLYFSLGCCLAVTKWYSMPWPGLTSAAAIGGHSKRGHGRHCQSESLHNKLPASPAAKHHCCSFATSAMFPMIDPDDHGEVPLLVLGLLEHKDQEARRFPPSFQWEHLVYYSYQRFNLYYYYQIFISLLLNPFKGSGTSSMPSSSRSSRSSVSALCIFSGPSWSNH